MLPAWRDYFLQVVGPREVSINWRDSMGSNKAANGDANETIRTMIEQQFD